jgi:integrase
MAYKFNVEAPNETEFHRMLIGSSTSPITIPPEVRDPARKFLWEINAPSHLRALFLVCTNVQQILLSAEQTWKVSLNKWNLEPWRVFLTWILPRDNLLSAIGGAWSDVFDPQEHPMKDFGIERYSVYAAMCNSHPEKDCQLLFQLLQAHLLVAHVSLMQNPEHTTLEQWESYAGKKDLLLKIANPEPAARAVRLIFGDPKNKSLLQKLELPLQSPPDLFLKKLGSAHLNETERDTFADIRVFFEKAFEGRTQITRRMFAGESSGWGARVGTAGAVIVEYEADLNDPDDEGSTRGKHATVNRAKLTEAEYDELLESDDCPLENEEEEETDLNVFDEPGFNKDPGAYHEASRAQANHVEMANQFFRWSYGSLVPAELYHLIIELPAAMMLLLTRQPLTQKVLDDLEVLALVQVMFWTSSPLELAQSLKVFGPTTTDKEKDVDLAFSPGSESEDPKWQIRAPLPEYAKQQLIVPEGTSRQITELLELPDVVRGSLLVQEYLNQRSMPISGSGRDGASDVQQSREFEAPKKTEGTSANVFCREESWYKQEVKLLLKGHPQGSQPAELSVSRLTEGKLANAMLERIFVESKGNWTATAIIAGRKLQLARVRLFYACPQVCRLQLLYEKATVGVDRELRMIPIAPHIEIKYRQAKLDSGKQYIGNRVCPTLKAVKDAVSLLRKEIEDFTKPKNKAESDRYHNLCTLYTIWMFSYCTGVRGIKTPYLSLSEIDTEQCLAVLTDKDRGLGYKAKRVWVPRALQTQMEAYKNFISRPSQVSDSEDKPCFFEPLRAMVKPSTQVPIMKYFLPYPVNIHRRFISSELLDRGCPPEIVSAWMGHWHRGEEPWAKFSSFSYSEYSRVLETYLLKGILKELKFEPIPFKVNYWTK